MDQSGTNQDGSERSQRGASGSQGDGNEECGIGLRQGRIDAGFQPLPHLHQHGFVARSGGPEIDRSGEGHLRVYPAIAHDIEVRATRRVRGHGDPPGELKPVSVFELLAEHGMELESPVNGYGAACHLKGLDSHLIVTTGVADIGLLRYLALQLHSPSGIESQVAGCKGPSGMHGAGEAQAESGRRQADG